MPASDLGVAFPAQVAHDPDAAVDRRGLSAVRTARRGARVLRSGGPVDGRCRTPADRLAPVVHPGAPVQSLRTDPGSTPRQAGPVPELGWRGVPGPATPDLSP